MESYFNQLREIIDFSQRKPMNEIIYEGIRKAIILGIIPVGARINQNAFSTYLNISRTPIRYSIERLKSEHLLEEHHNHGVIVRKVTVSDVEEIFKLRITLETLAAINAMQSMSEQEFADVDALLQQTMRANAQDDVQQVINDFSKFNQLLLEYARMPRLVIVVEQLKEYLIRFRDISLEDKERRTRALYEHILIFHCIKTKDQKLIQLIITEHLEVAKQFILDQIKKTEGDDDA